MPTRQAVGTISSCMARAGCRDGRSSMAGPELDGPSAPSRGGIERSRSFGGAHPFVRSPSASAVTLRSAQTSRDAR